MEVKMEKNALKLICFYCLQRISEIKKDIDIDKVLNADDYANVGKKIEVAKILKIVEKLMV